MLNEKETLERLLKINQKEMKLKPCPFCGGEAEVYIRAEFAYSPMLSGIANAFGVRCKKCNAYTIHAPDEEDSIIKWNRRYKNGR